MDAFSHAAEAFTSVLHNPMSDILALEAISLVVRYLPIAVKDGSNAEARSKMSFASTIAGMSFNDATPHLGHAIAHTMGAKFHVPHGTGCGLAMPLVIEYVSDIMPDRVRAIGKAIGLNLSDDLSNEESGVAVADAIRKLIKEISLPSMKDLNIQESGLKSIAEDTPGDVCAIFIPKKTTSDDVLKLLQKEYALS
jgi:alcohol dehydrogenase